jgi:hypothetical protein
LFIRLATPSFLNSGCLGTNILPSQSSNTTFNLLDMGIDQRIDACFGSLVDSCSIHSTFKQ